MTRKTPGAIAAGHPRTVEAGQLMFEAGGNAFDAAIAATLASCVVESTLTSLGGGGFLLAHTCDHKALLFDFFCQTPRQKASRQNIDFYPVHIDFGGAKQTFHIGLGSIAVPGTLAGVAQVQRRLGKLPFSVVAEPAIHYARHGFTVTPFNVFAYQLLESILLARPESRSIYAPQGQLPQAGDPFYSLDFANILEQLSQNGIDVFYKGDLAQQIAQDLEEGGFLTLADFQNYHVQVRRPLTVHYRGYEILTNPPPSSGGILIAFALKLLEAVDFSQIEWGSDRHWQLLVQVMALTNQAREQGYDRAIHHPDISQNFLSPPAIHPYQAKLNPPSSASSKWGSTTHISTLDGEGNAASITNSNGEGSAYILANTGIMLNNMLGESDLNPLGFHQWQCNQRLSSMMSPTMILKDGKPEIVLGSGGSNRIRTAILQVISNLIDFQLPLSEAVTRARLHWEQQVLDLEPRDRNFDGDRHPLPPGTGVKQWSASNMFFGGVHAVGLAADQSLTGMGDPRRAGVAWIGQ